MQLAGRARPRRKLNNWRKIAFAGLCSASSRCLNRFYSTDPLVVTAGRVQHRPAIDEALPRGLRVPTPSNIAICVIVGQFDSIIATELDRHPDHPVTQTLADTYSTYSLT